MDKKLIKKLLIGFALISVCLFVGAILSIDHAFNDMFGACNVKKPMSPETFKSLCEKQQAGTSLKKVKDALGFVNTYRPECNESNICTLQIEGGRGVFCDSCLIEYNKETGSVISTTWLFGDD